MTVSRQERQAASRRTRRASRRRRRVLIAGGLGLVTVIVAAWLVTSGDDTTSSVAVRRPPATTTSSTVPPTTQPVTTTTVDPGTLPQTMDRPNAASPVFQDRMRALWDAIVADDPNRGMSSFFPLSAYLQVKDISNPAGDWQSRLVASFGTDVHALHAQLGAGASRAQLVGIDVPDAQAQWILPGAEYNKGSYWRVYGTVLRYTLDGASKQLAVTSLISWRGEWYVVHLGPIR